MTKVCVVTGGGSGMGLSTAKIMDKDHYIILVGRTVAKLEGALKELTEAGAKAEIFPCDASDRDSVKKLVERAAEVGEISAVIHAAGMSPNMGDAATIFKVNALGTIFINEEFAKAMGANSCILNVSSMSAYMGPPEQMPREVYKLSLQDAQAFLTQMNNIFATLPAETAAGAAYMMSKNFVVWYTEKMAVKHGSKGIRIVSISPGTFSTPMGDLEGEQAAAFAKAGALGRVGDPEEIAVMMAFMASEKCSYLTGVDILYDGGSVAAMRTKAELDQ